MSQFNTITMKQEASNQREIPQDFCKYADKGGNLSHLFSERFENRRFENLMATYDDGFDPFPSKGEDKPYVDIVVQMGKTYKRKPEGEGRRLSTRPLIPWLSCPSHKICYTQESVVTGWANSNLDAYSHFCLSVLVKAQTFDRLPTVPQWKIISRIGKFVIIPHTHVGEETSKFQIDGVRCSVLARLLKITPQIFGFERVTEASDAVKSVADRIADALSNFEKSVSHIKDSILNTLNGQNYTSGITRFQNVLRCLCLLALEIPKVLASPTLPVISASAATIILGSGLAMGMIKHVIHFLNKLGEACTIQIQDGTDTFHSRIATALSELVAILGDFKHTPKFLMEKILVLVKNLGLFSRSISSIVALWNNTLKDLCCDLFYYITGIPRYDEALTARMKGADNIIAFLARECSGQRWNDLIGSNNVISVEEKRHIAYTLLRHESTLNSLRVSMTPTFSSPLKKSDPVLDRIGKLLLEIKEKIGKLRECGVLSAEMGTHPEPFHIGLGGLPGVGKSTVVRLITTVLMSEMGISDVDDPKFDVADHIYSRISTSEYWAGYKNQFCTLLDDFGALSDIPGNPNPNFLDLLNIYTSESTSLNMAGVSEKGNTFFNSPLIVSTYNREVKPTSLTNPEALERRFDIRVAVSVRHHKGCILKTSDKKQTYVGAGEGSLEHTVFIIEKVGEEIQKHLGLNVGMVLPIVPFLHACVAILKLKVCKMGQKSTALKNMLVAFRDSKTRTIQVQHGGEEKDASLSEQNVLDGKDENVVHSDTSSEASFQDFDFESSFDAPHIRNGHYHSGSTPSAEPLFVPLGPELDIPRGTLDEEIPDTPSHSVLRFAEGRVVLDLIMRTLNKVPYNMVDVTSSAFDVLPKKFKVEIIDTIVVHYIKSLPTYPPSIVEILSDFSYLEPSYLYPMSENVVEDLDAYLSFSKETSKDICTRVINMCANVITHPLALVATMFKDPPIVSEEVPEASGGFFSTLHAFTKSTWCWLGLLGVAGACLGLALVGIYKHFISPPANDTAKVDDAATERKSSTEVPSVETQGKAGLHYAQREVARLNRQHRMTREQKVKLDEEWEKDLEFHGRFDFQSGAVDRREKAVEALKKIQPTKNALDVAVSMANNTYRVYRRGKGVDDALGTFVFLRGNTGMMPRHFLVALGKCDEFSLVRPGVENRSWFPPSRLMVHKDVLAHTDLCLVTLPCMTANHADIVHLFATRSELGRVEYPRGFLFGTRHDVDGTFAYAQCVTDINVSVSSILDLKQGNILTGVTSYSATTIPGDCGMVLILDVDCISRKIFGMHSALSRPLFGEPRSHGSIISCEEINESLSNILSVDNIITVFPDGLRLCIPSDFYVADDKGGVHAIAATRKVPIDYLDYGRLDYPTPMIPSKIEPSPIHGLVFDSQGRKLGPCKAPAKLTPFDKDGIRVSPFQQALLKNATPSVDIDPFVVDEVLDEFFHLFADCDPLHSITMEEACFGDELDKYIGPLDRSKSSGYPLSKDHQGKYDFLGKGDDKNISPEFRVMVEEFIADAKRGVQQSVVHIETLKDERRPPEKVEAPRLFSAGALVFLVVFRMYYGSFMALVIRLRIVCGIAVGIDPLTEWTALARHLTKFGDKLFAGDFSKFDASLQRYILHEIGLRIEAMHDGDVQIRRVLWRSITDSLHLANGHLYGWTKSLSSGNPITSILNSIYVCVAFRVVYKILAKKHDPLVSDKFDRYVSMISYGDDNVVGVSNQVPWFNQNTVTPVFKESMGMIYTLEDKSGAKGPDFRPLSGVSFLKRRFVQDQIYGYLCPLDLETVYDMVHWVSRSSNSYNGVFEMVVATAFRELCLHDSCVYNEFLGAVRRALRKVHRSKGVVLYGHATLRAAVYRDAVYGGTIEVQAGNLSAHLGVGEKILRVGVYVTTPLKTTVNLRVNTHALMGVGAWQANHSFKQEGNALLDTVCLYKQRTNVPLILPRDEWVAGIFYKTTISKSTDFENIGGLVGEHPYEGDHNDLVDVQKQELVTFVDASGSMQNEPDVVSRPHVEVPLECRVHSITRFLERPAKMASLTLNTTSSGIVSTTVVPHFTDMIRSKLEGFRYMRANMHFKVTLNASPYALGRLFMWYSPMAPGSIPDPTTQLSRIFGYPGVEIDVGTGTSPELYVPFVYDRTYLDFRSDFSTTGNLRVSVVTPLAGTSSGETADVAIYAWLSEIDLGIPGPFPTVRVQSGEGASRASSNDSTRSKAKPASLSFLNDLLKPIDWLGDTVADGLTAMGLSKPHNLQPPSNLANVPSMGYANTNAVDSGVVLSLDPRNSIAMRNGFFNCDHDAMDIGRLVSREVFLSTNEWTTSDSIDTEVLRYPVGNFPKSTALGYLLDTFSMWRGSIVLRLSAVKNAFYSGRLSVEFISGDGNFGSTQEAFNYIPRKIWDLRTNNELRLEIPFHNDTPWYGAYQIVGLLVVRVINPLRVTPSLPTTININLYVAGGSDFAVAAPFDVNIVTQSGALTELEPTSKSNRSHEGAHKYFDIGATDQTSEAITIGESITNLRTLVMRSGISFSTTQITGEQKYFDPSSFGQAPRSSPLDVYSRLFRFWRGSLRVKFFLRTRPVRIDGSRPDFMLFRSKLLDLINIPSNPAITPFTGAFGSAEHTTYPHLNPVHEITVPYYRNNTISVVGDGGRSVSRPAILFILLYDNQNVSDTPAVFDVYVSAGDDFSLGFQIGPGATVP